MKHLIIATAVAIAVAGCAAPSSSFQNANGQVFNCTASGFGVLGTTAALLSHSECERKAQEAGYRPVNATSVNPTKLAANPTNVQVDWPAGWAKKDLTEDQVKRGLTHFGSEKTRDLAAQISVIASEGITDRMAYAASRRANQASRLSQAKGTDIVNATINGRDAQRFEVTGNLANGQGMTYGVTIIYGAEQLVYITTWASAPNYAEHKVELTGLADRVTGIR